MPENQNFDACNKPVKEAVCIDTKRIYDSCVSKDCLEDLRVSFSSANQAIVDNAVTVKCRDAQVEAVSIDVEEVPFNRGFYGVDITFYFKIVFDTYSSPCTTPTVVVGYTKYQKKCILFGSDGNVKIFTSNLIREETDCPESPEYSNPTAKIQLVDPVILSCDTVDVCDCNIGIPSSFPQSILRCLCPESASTVSTNCLPPSTPDKAVLVTLGLFSIVQMERDVQMLIPAYDYCIPDRECNCNTDNPCETFNKIDFPVEEFFPQERPDPQSTCGCSD